MVEKFLQIAGVRNEQEFYNKYPTEDAFFRAHPNALSMQKFADGGEPCPDGQVKVNGQCVSVEEAQQRRKIAYERGDVFEEDPNEPGGYRTVGTMKTITVAPTKSKYNTQHYDIGVGSGFNALTRNGIPASNMWDFRLPAKGQLAAQNQKWKSLLPGVYDRPMYNPLPRLAGTPATGYSTYEQPQLKSAGPQRELTPEEKENQRWLNYFYNGSSASQKPNDFDLSLQAYGKHTDAMERRGEFNDIRRETQAHQERMREGLANYVYTPLLGAGALATAAMAAPAIASSPFLGTIGNALKTPITTLGTEYGTAALTPGNLLGLGFGMQGSSEFADPNSATRQSLRNAYNNPTFSNILDATGNTLGSGLGVLGSPGVAQGLGFLGTGLVTNTPLKNTWKLNPYSGKVPFLEGQPNWIKGWSKDYSDPTKIDFSGMAKFNESLEGTSIGRQIKRLNNQWNAGKLGRGEQPYREYSNKLLNLLTKGQLKNTGLSELFNVDDVYQSGSYANFAAPLKYTPNIVFKYGREPFQGETSKLISSGFQDANVSLPFHSQQIGNSEIASLAPRVFGESTMYGSTEIPRSAAAEMAWKLRNLKKQGIYADWAGNNFLYNPQTNKVSVFDLNTTPPPTTFGNTFFQNSNKANQNIASIMKKEWNIAPKVKTTLNNIPKSIEGYKDAQSLKGANLKDYLNNYLKNKSIPSTLKQINEKIYLTLQNYDPDAAIASSLKNAKESVIDDYGKILTDKQYERFRRDVFGNDANLIPLEDFKNAHQESINHFKTGIAAGGKEHGLFIKNKFADRIPNFNSIKFDNQGNRIFEHFGNDPYSNRVISNIDIQNAQGYDITKLTPQQRQMIEAYAHGYDKSLNGALRNPGVNSVSQFYQQQGDVLNQGILQNKFQTPSVVRRGINSDYDVELLDPVTHQPTGVTKLRSELGLGDTFMDKSFLSTSTNPESHWGAQDLSEFIEIPGGGVQSVAFPEAATFTNFRGENEAILPKGLIRQITGVNQTTPGISTPRFMSKILNPYTLTGLMFGLGAATQKQKYGGPLVDYYKGRMTGPNMFAEGGQANRYYYNKGYGVPMLDKAEDGKEYKGYSIVDYLASKGYSGKKAFRKELAKDYGVEDYDFSAEKNLELLGKIRENQEILSKREEDFTPVPVEEFEKVKKVTSTSRRLPNKTKEGNVYLNPNDVNARLNLMLHSPKPSAPKFKPFSLIGTPPVTQRLGTLPVAIRNTSSQQVPVVSQQNQQPSNFQPFQKYQGRGVSLELDPNTYEGRPDQPVSRILPPKTFKNTTASTPVVKPASKAPKQTFPYTPNTPSGINTWIDPNTGRATFLPPIKKGTPIINMDQPKEASFWDHPIDYAQDWLASNVVQAKGNIDKSIESAKQTISDYWEGAKKYKQLLEKENPENVKETDESQIFSTNPTKPTVAQSQTKSTDAQNVDDVIYGYHEFGDVPDRGTRKLAKFSYTFDNDKGARYIIGHKVKEVTDAGAQKHFKNVKAVAHFLRDSDILPDQKIAPKDWTVHGGNTFHSTIPGKAATSIGFDRPDWYRALYKPDPDHKDGSYLIKYIKNRDITKEKEDQLKKEGWNLDFTVSGQYKFSDVDWEGEGPSTKYAAVSKWLPLKNGDHTYIPYKDKKGFSRFSGGSITYLFKNPKTGKTVGIDIAGSVDDIKKAGQGIIKKYAIKPEDLEIVHHDMGSYSGKPKAKNNELDYDQWIDFNSYNQGFSGAPLMIPSNKFGGELKSPLMQYYYQKLGRF